MNNILIDDTCHISSKAEVHFNNVHQLLFQCVEFCGVVNNKSCPISMPIIKKSLLEMITECSKEYVG